MTSLILGQVGFTVTIFNPKKLKNSPFSVSKFVTDRQYHGDTPIEGEELQEWNGGEEDGLGGSIEDDVVVAGGQTAARRSNNHNNGTGWSVNDMFAANEKMNVVSTFKEDLTQYTT